MSILNSPDLIFEMFPFIFLLTTQVFFINFFENNQIQIFKYSGLKNIKILLILVINSIFIGLVIITFFYNFSSYLKGHYIQLKSKYSTNDEYLAVVTKNGLWIKDVVEEKIYIINANEIKDNYIVNVFISEFNKNFELIRNIKSNKIDISKKEWNLYDVKIFKEYNSKERDSLILKSNFDIQIVRNLFSNLSTQSIYKLLELRKNYISLNYSTVEIDIQIQKILTYPIYLALMTVLSGIIMFNTKRYKNSTFKIVLGLFLSVIIYYLINFFHVLGESEKVPVLFSIFLPLFLLFLVNTIMILKINEK
jgi:lipopolysaccharide export system permease protein